MINSLPVGKMQLMMEKLQQNLSHLSESVDVPAGCTS